MNSLQETKIKGTVAKAGVVEEVISLDIKKSNTRLKKLKIMSNKNGRITNILRNLRRSTIKISSADITRIVKINNIIQEEATKREKSTILKIITMKSRKFITLSKIMTGINTIGAQLTQNARTGAIIKITARSCANISKCTASAIMEINVTFHMKNNHLEKRQGMTRDLHIGADTETITEMIGETITTMIGGTPMTEEMMIEAMMIGAVGVEEEAAESEAEVEELLEAPEAVVVLAEMRTNTLGTSSTTMGMSLVNPTTMTIEGIWVQNSRTLTSRRGKIQTTIPIKSQLTFTVMTVLNKYKKYGMLNLSQNKAIKKKEDLVTKRKDMNQSIRMNKSMTNRNTNKIDTINLNIAKKSQNMKKDPNMRKG